MVDGHWLNLPRRLSSKCCSSSELGNGEWGMGNGEWGREVKEQTRLTKSDHLIKAGWRDLQRLTYPIFLTECVSPNQLTSCTILNKSKNLTPQPPSHLPLPPPTRRGKRKNFCSWKGEPEILLPSPFRGGVKLIIATGARSHNQQTSCIN